MLHDEADNTEVFSSLVWEQNGRKCFQMYFLTENDLYFDSNFNEDCYEQFD